METIFDTKEILTREERGEIRDTLTGSRVMIFSCSAYRAMCDTLFERFRSGAGTILYAMGEGYWKKLFLSFSEYELHRDETIAALTALADIAGWGTLSVNVIDDNNAVCIVRKSPFVLRRNEVVPLRVSSCPERLRPSESSWYRASFCPGKSNAKLAGLPFADSS